MSRLVLTLMLLALLGILSGRPVAAQGGGNRAALVVADDRGNITKRCVTFTEASITGLELLQRAGLAMTIKYSGGGAAVCSIGGYGCSYPQKDCFCKCPGAQCEYWAYWHWNDGAWGYSQVGASGYTVRGGALEGWAWGAGSFGVSGAIPPAVTFDEICPAPTATPTATPTRTVTPTPTSPPTLTPTPTATVRVSDATSTPTARAAGALPELSFEASNTSLASNACAVLRWVAWNTEQVTLDGAAVAAQDRREVCPAATQRYVLVAQNAAGQTAREVVIAVAGSPAQATATVTAIRTPSGGATAMTPAGTTPVATATLLAAPPVTPLASVTQMAGTTAAPAPQAVAAAHAAAQTAPSVQSVPSVPIDTAPASAPTRSPTIPTPIIVGPPTAGRTARRTPMPGQPTPTPMLVARVSPEPGGDGSAWSGAASAQAARPEGAGLEAPAPDRRFRSSLLPGYAAYSLMMATLMGAGGAVARKRRRPAGGGRGE